MSRRAAGGALALAALTTAVPTAGAADPAPQLPLATCAARVNDPTGDGIPTYGAGNVNGVPNVGDPRGNVPALDITAITLRVTATKVLAFMTLADIPDATYRATDSAYGYTTWFTRNGAKVARFDLVDVNPAHAQQGLAPAANSATASVGTTASGGAAIAGVTGAVDRVKNVVYVAVPRPAMEQALGEPLADGEVLTAINGRTEQWQTKGDVGPGVVRRPADQTDVPAANAVWKVGDDRCFAAAKVTVPAVVAQYGDAVTLVATLTDEAGKPLAGRTVSFAVPGESRPRSITTDAQGVALVRLAAAPLAKTYAFVVSYAGDEFAGPGQATGTLTVRTETIRVSAPKVTKNGSARTVTATFTEDDPRAFAKQQVAWYVNGKKVATSVTDSAGRAVFKGAKPGQKVQVRYAGVPGRYAPAASATVTA